MKTLGLIYFTQGGKTLGEKIITSYKNNYIICPDEGKKQWVKELFPIVDGIIFIGAIGIAVRYIAPLLEGKDKDPGIIVLDEKGEYVIPILSGHLGGGNSLAIEISEKISAKPVITTATDVNGVMAIDVYALENKLAIENLKDIKTISATLLKGEEVGFYTDLDWETPKGLVKKSQGDLGVFISPSPSKSPFKKGINLIPKTLVLGVGCRKNVDSQIFENWILDKLEELNINVLSIFKIASIDLKKEEKCIIDFAKKYKLELEFYTSEELKQVEGSQASSEFVKSVTGIDNVCERASLLASKGKLVVNKIKGNSMTMAIGEIDRSKL